MSIRDHLIAARRRLTDAGISAGEAALDSALLGRHLLGWSRATLLAHDTDPEPDGFAARLDDLVTRRARREPISSVLGVREFWGRDFEVTRDVLTPRQETELIVEHAVAVLGGVTARTRTPLTIVDVGTGSACLAVCLALEFVNARVIATDMSEAALAVAGRNAARHGVASQIEFRCTSLLDGVAPPVQLIVSNPPYVPTPWIPGLSKEVRQWDPQLALDGGTDGLALVRQLIADVPRVLEPGGWFIMEFGFGQEDEVRSIAATSPLTLVRVVNDLQGIARTLVCRA